VDLTALTDSEATFATKVRSCLEENHPASPEGANDQGRVSSSAAPGRRGMPRSGWAGVSLAARSYGGAAPPDRAVDFNESFRQGQRVPLPANVLGPRHGWPGRDSPTANEETRRSAIWSHPLPARILVPGVLLSPNGFGPRVP